MKIALETLGCKLNQAETESLTWQFAAIGWEFVSDILDADVYVLNTCTVTATADAKARQRLRMVHKRNPTTFIVAAGCYAQRDPEKLSAVDGVSLVISNENKSRLPAILAEHFGQAEGIASCLSESSPGSMRTRAFIKVQEGCDGACAYCIVPKVRSLPYSVSARQVLTEIKTRLACGFKEIVITGTEVGSYREGPLDLKGLLKTILDETEVPRLRLSSLQPQEISSSLLSFWRDARLCRHFHLSLQSGSDNVLRAMRRRYSVGRYIDAVNLIRVMIPDVAVTTDIIVGFPGETDAEFEESIDICRKMNFARIHVFPYSPRPGTIAASMVDRIDEATKRSRTERMLVVAEECAGEFYRAFKGKTRPVLWERRDSTGAWTGFTDNYIPVTRHCAEDLQNRITPFVLE